MGDPYWSDEKFVNTTDNVFRNTVDNVFFDSSTPNKSGTRPTIRGGTKVVLPTTGLGVGVVNQDYARKPYLADSYDEMMRRSTYRGAYNQVLMRQSEFEKPYLEDDYQEMQHFFAIPPLPPWGEWDWIPPEGTTGGPPGGIPGLGGLPGGPKPGISSGFCDITCWDGGSWYGDPCEEALGDCHLAVSTLGVSGTWTVSGPVKKIEYFRDHIQSFPAKDINNAKSIYIHADWDNIEKIDDKKEAEFTVRYIDERGNKCETEVTISCIEKCDCYTEPAFVYDTDNAETMAADSSLRLYVENGCSPFSWSVSGTGFSFAEGKTDGHSNYLVASASACGSASITVTDDCNVIVTGWLRGTTGEWVEKSTGVCEISGVGTEIDTSTYELITGNKKQTQVTGSDASGCPGHGCEAGQEAFCEGRGPLGLTTNCIDPLSGGCDYPYAMPCSSMDYDAICDSGRRFFAGDTDCWQCFHVAALAYYEWECAP